MMTVTMHVLCLWMAFVFFLLAAFGVPASVRWEWLGAAAVVLAWLT